MRHVRLGRTGLQVSGLCLGTMLFPQIERELLPLCAAEGLGVIPYNPLAIRPPMPASRPEEG